MLPVMDDEMRAALEDESTTAPAATQENPVVLDAEMRAALMDVGTAVPTAAQGTALALGYETRDTASAATFGTALAPAQMAMGTTILASQESQDDMMPSRTRSPVGRQMARPSLALQDGSEAIGLREGVTMRPGTRPPVTS